MNFEKELERGDEYFAEIFDEELEYSDTDEVLDNNIYYPQPIDYYDEEGNEKVFDPINDRKWKKRLNKDAKQAHLQKNRRKALDDFDLFIMKNYDPVNHNITLEQVRNFEVYNPNNNISKMKVEMEMQRIQNMLAMKVKFKAKHILPLLIKGFRLYDTGGNN